MVSSKYRPSAWQFRVFIQNNMDDDERKISIIERSDSINYFEKRAGEQVYVASKRLPIAMVEQRPAYHRKKGKWFFHKKGSGAVVERTTKLFLLLDDPHPFIHLLRYTWCIHGTILQTRFFRFFFGTHSWCACHFLYLAHSMNIFHGISRTCTGKESQPQFSHFRKLVYHLRTFPKYFII